MAPVTPTASEGFSYAEVGATAGPLPSGYRHTRARRRIGSGPELFEAAASSITAFGMQKGAGVFGDSSTATAEPGTEVSLRLGLGPLAIAARCRVIYVVDELHRRGFAYGTLPGHPEIGEELFSVELDPATGAVDAVIVAFSRPGRWYTTLGGPVGRLVQRRITERYLRAVSPPG